MEESENNQEWFESADPEIEYNDLSRTAIPRYTNPVNTNTEFHDINTIKTYQSLKNEFDNRKKELSVTATAVTEEESPVEKFYRIRNEIDVIEKDVEYYKDNVISNNYRTNILKER